MLKQPVSIVPRFIVGTVVSFVFFFGGHLFCVGNDDAYGTVVFLMV